MQRLREVEACRLSVLPDRDQAQHLFGPEVVRQVLDDRERLGVGPVQVLEHEQATATTAGRSQEPEDALGDSDDPVEGCVVHPPLRHETSQGGAERTEHVGIAHHCTAHGGRERLRERAVGSRGRCMRGPSLEHRHRSQRGFGSDRPRQGGLADARLEDVPSSVELRWRPEGLGDVHEII
ncbi:MAG: hypothetical protein M3P31_05475, partial [Actinomycetota bacterium]|nr:hypothetical protein [Actinomycetota bacterium]